MTTVSSGGGAQLSTQDEHLNVWVSLPNRWRIESVNRIDVRDGVHRWIGTQSHVTELDIDESRDSSSDVVELLSPADGVAGLRFAEPSEDAVLGRRSWRVEASPRESRVRPMGGFSSPFRGVDQIFWFDAETGIVLRHHGSVAGEPCSVTEFKELILNEPVSAEKFQFQPERGTVVERHTERLVRHAESMGIDLTDVNQSDAKAVQRAISETRRPFPPLARNLGVQKDKHLPLGAPPENVEEARAAIDYAYSHIAETDDSGERFINVQGSPQLTREMSQARNRLPLENAETATGIVDEVKFLRDDEAVVWYSVMVDGKRTGFVAGREGRAVMEDGRWVVEHATLIDLLLLAGVSPQRSSP